MSDGPSRPAFTGLLVHHDQRFGFSVLVPDGWQRLALEGSDSGVFYAPDAADALTGLAIDATDLGVRVHARDLQTLRRGFLKGLSTLAEARIEREESEAVGDLLTLEALLTFSGGKRWVRLLYQGRTQLRLIAQAASVELLRTGSRCSLKRCARCASADGEGRIFRR